MVLDTAGSSSMYALDLAFDSIKSGKCDAALVGGSNLCLHPTITRQFLKYITIVFKHFVAILYIIDEPIFSD